MALAFGISGDALGQMRREDKPTCPRSQRARRFFPLSSCVCHPSILNNARERRYFNMSRFPTVDVDSGYLGRASALGAT